MRKIFCKILIISLLINIACQKISPAPDAVLIPERIEINPNNLALMMGNSSTLSAKMFDNQGNTVNPTPSFNWTSTDTQIATVNNQGEVKTLKVGQVQIQAENKGVKAMALVTITENLNQIATIQISPEMPELTKNQMQQLIANALNINNMALNGKTFTWQSDNPNIVETSSEGILNAKQFGTVHIQASSEGIQSSPLMVAVIRKGNFEGKTGHYATGIAKLKIENTILKLIFESNFVVGGGPDYRVYLSNDANGISGAYELALLQKFNGTQTYNIPNTISIEQYRYMVIWCKQYSVLVGVADLGSL